MVWPGRAGPVPHGFMFYVWKLFFILWTLCLESILSEICVALSFHMWPQKEALHCELARNDIWIFTRTFIYNHLISLVLSSHLQSPCLAYHKKFSWDFWITRLFYVSVRLSEKKPLRPVFFSGKQQVSSSEKFYTTSGICNWGYMNQWSSDKEQQASSSEKLYTTLVICNCGYMNQWSSDKERQVSSSEKLYTASGICNCGYMKLWTNGPVIRNSM